MASSDNTSKQRLIRQIEEHETTESRFFREKVAGMWKRYIRTQIDLSPAMSEVVRRQGYNRNRAKPIGLFFDEVSIIAKQDNEIAVASDEAKRRSLIESFYYNAQLLPDDVESLDKISRNEVIPQVAKILEASALSTPRVKDLEQYVETRYRSAATITR